MAGMSSTRSWVAVIFVLIPRAYLNSYFLAIVRAKRKCLATDYQNAVLLDTLTVAYAAAGRWSDAVQTAHTALAQAEATDQTALADWLRAWLARHEPAHADHDRPAAHTGKQSSPDAASPP